jgi:hypothetical protein
LMVVTRAVSSGFLAQPETSITASELMQSAHFSRIRITSADHPS